MSKFTEAKVADMKVGQTVAMPTEHGGTHNGRIVAVTPAPGMYARPGALDVTLVQSDESTVTLRTNANYSGYVTDDGTYFEEFVAQYAHTILWQSPEDDEGNLLNDAHTTDDFTADAMDEMRANCRDFLTEDTRAILDRLAESNGYDAGAAGHDFALTRNGHGAGFWDRGLGDDGDTLTDRAKSYGEQHAYEGDDGYLHVM